VSLPLAADPGWNGLAADIRRARTARGRARLGCFAIEGTRAHERAVRAGAPLVSVLASLTYRRSGDLRVEALLSALDGLRCPVLTAPDAVLEELTDGRDLGAVLGLVRLPRTFEIDDLLGTGQPPARLWLVGLDVEDPGNVGALVRTALASGAAAYVAVGRGDPFHPRAVRTAMGSLFKLKVVRAPRAREVMDALRRAGLAQFGASTRGGLALGQARLGSAGVAVWVGSEAFGLPAEVLRELDQTVTVPMAPGVDSLSVNAAAAVILYEARRQLGFE